jgi:hypothetical protein
MTATPAPAAPASAARRRITRGTYLRLRQLLEQARAAALAAQTADAAADAVAQTVADEYGLGRIELVGIDDAGSDYVLLYHPPTDTEG